MTHGDRGRGPVGCRVTVASWRLFYEERLALGFAWATQSCTWAEGCWRVVGVCFMCHSHVLLLSVCVCVCVSVCRMFLLVCCVFPCAPASSCQVWTSYQCQEWASLSLISIQIDCQLRWLCLCRKPKLQADMQIRSSSAAPTWVALTRFAHSAAPVFLIARIQSCVLFSDSKAEESGVLEKQSRAVNCVNTILAVPVGSEAYNEWKQVYANVKSWYWINKCSQNSLPRLCVCVRVCSVVTCGCDEILHEQQSLFLSLKQWHVIF